jgi:hypothetical protein
MSGGAKPPDGSPAGGPGSGGAGGAPAAARPAGGDHPGGGPTGEGQGRGPGGGGPDFQQLLARSPAVPLKDLQKGNMVIVVATAGQTPASATAITVVAGVEPMLQASTKASQALLSSSWNLGGGGGGEGGGGEGQQ